VLRCDIYRYFPAIDHQIVKEDLRRRIACPRTLWLLDAVLINQRPSGRTASKPASSRAQRSDLVEIAASRCSSQ
jgi:hypothetical protein